MAKRVAVVTDATSPGYFFPSWVAYYGGLFGRENLFVVTYRGLAGLFSDYALGGIWELKSDFSETVRADIVAEIVAIGLAKYDAVVRCDVDEFIVADPRRHASLASYIDGLDLPCVTTMGLDVIERDEDRLRIDGSGLLGQRSYCVRSAAYCKTAIARVPLKWSVGFHHADVRPVFDAAYLFHMKYADFQGRLEWFSHMLATSAPGSAEQAHYSGGLDELHATRARFGALPIVEGWREFDDPAYWDAFARSVEEPRPGENFYRNRFGTEDAALRIPDAFRRLF